MTIYCMCTNTQLHYKYTGTVKIICHLLRFFYWIPTEWYFLFLCLFYMDDDCSIILCFKAETASLIPASIVKTVLIFIESYG